MFQSGILAAQRCYETIAKNAKIILIYMCEFISFLSPSVC